MKSRMNIRKFLCGVLATSSIFLAVDFICGGSMPIAHGLLVFLLGVLTASSVSAFIAYCNKFEY